MTTLLDKFNKLGLPKPIFVKSAAYRFTVMFPALIINTETNTLYFECESNVLGKSSIYWNSKILDMECDFNLINYSEDYLIEFVYMNILITNDYPITFISYTRKYLCKNLYLTDFEYYISQTENLNIGIHINKLSPYFINLLNDFDIKDAIIIDCNFMLDNLLKNTNIENVYTENKILDSNNFIFVDKVYYNNKHLYNYHIERNLVKSAIKI